MPKTRGKKGALALRGQLAEDKRVGDHVVDRVVAVREVVEGPLFVDDADGGVLRADAHALDIVGRLAELLELVVQDVGGLHGGLCVELGGEGDLEEDIFHDVRAVGDLELERLAL